MPPPLLLDLSKVDMTKVMFDVTEVEKTNPHRGAMRMLDRVVHVNEDFSEAVGCKDIGTDEFWVAGHIPGRPLFPGVLMIELAAQLASFLCLRRMEGQRFLGFAGADGFKFRGQVTTGDQLIVMGKEVEFRPRRFICQTQGVVRGSMVFEGQITGMPM